MERREFGLDANGYPVYPGETMYRKSNADKYTVQEDGSLKKGNGKTVTSPDWSHFVHTYDKTDKAEQFAAARAKRHTPRPDNPLVEGDYKTRTPEEASKAAAKQREQERKKESAALAPQTPTLGQATNEELAEEVNRRGLVFAFHIRLVPDRLLIEEMERRGLNKTAAALAPTLDKATDAEILGEVTHREDLFQRIQITALATASDDDILAQYQERGLLLSDSHLADELRRRGYAVKATKLVEL